MVNSAQLIRPSGVPFGASKSAFNNRRPLQPRCVNTTTSSPSPAKSAKASKPKMNPIKSRSEPQIKLCVVSEDSSSSWPTLDKDMRTSPSLESEPEETLQPSIFRRRSDLEDDGENASDMFVLKRASPVYDSDDEGEMISPPKRQRTAESSILNWGEHLSESDDGFSLSFNPAH